MIIREISKSEWPDFQRFFNRGLVEKPTCFRISPTDLATLSFPSDETQESFSLGAFDASGAWMGTASFKREGMDRERLRHRGLLFWMYVADEFGGRGVGRGLITEVVRRVKTYTDVEQIILTVVGDNDKARRLYESMDFELYGYGPRAIKLGDVYMDEALMVLFLER